MKPGPDFDQRRQKSGEDDSPSGRSGNSGKHLEKSALPRPIPPDDPHRFATLDMEVHIVKRTEACRLSASAVACSRSSAAYSAGARFLTSSSALPLNSSGGVLKT